MMSPSWTTYSFPSSRKRPRFFYSLFRTVFDQIIIGHGHGTNKSFFKIRVDDSSCLRSFHATFEGPSTHLFFTSCEISAKSQQVEAARVSLSTPDSVRPIALKILVYLHHLAQKFLPQHAQKSPRLPHSLLPQSHEFASHS